jgi:hypothetical protein
MLNAYNLKTRLDTKKLLKILTDVDRRPEVAGDTIRFRFDSLETQIQATQCEQECPSGLKLDQMVRVQTVLPNSREFTPADLASLNRLAGMSGLVQTGGNVSLVSRIPIFRGEETTTDFIAIVALTQSFWWRQTGVRINRGNLDEWLSAMPLSNDACSWGADDFRSVGDLLRGHRIAAMEGKDWLTAEFPWEAGAGSATYRSLFEMRATRNPLLGNGLFYKLELPVVFEEKDTAHAAAVANEDEASATDTLPFVGAWCQANDSERIAFVGFLPNCVRSVIMHASFALWNAARSAELRDVWERDRCRNLSK